MPDSLPQTDARLSCVTPADPPERLLAARYRDRSPAPPAQWNSVLAGLLAHRSVRAFLPEPLPDGLLQTLLAAAQSAASSSNLQTASVIAVTDPARKARLAELAGGQKHIVQAPVLLVWLADLSRLARLGAARGQQVEGLAYLESLFVAIIDAALAAQNTVVAAESLGLGTVYIGAMRNQPERVAAELALPPQVLAVFGLCLGRPDPAGASGVKPRLAQSLVLHREQYGAGDDAASIAVYDAAIQDFQREQAIPAVPWSRQALARVAGAASLSGRDRMQAALAALGFALR